VDAGTALVPNDFAAAIKRDLPNFPNEVVIGWLLEFAREDGWPPLAARWKSVMCNRTLGFWAALTWQIVEVRLRPGSFDSESWERIEGVLLANVRGPDGKYSQLRNTAARFKGCCQYLRANGCVPWPPVAIQTGRTLHVADGFHRLAASLHLKSVLGLEDVRLWVGTSKSGLESGTT